MISRVISWVISRVVVASSVCVWEGGGSDRLRVIAAMIIDLIRAVPPGTFDSCLLAYGWNLITQDVS